MGNSVDPEGQSDLGPHRLPWPVYPKTYDNYGTSIAKEYIHINVHTLLDIQNKKITHTSKQLFKPTKPGSSKQSTYFEWQENE